MSLSQSKNEVEKKIHELLTTPGKKMEDLSMELRIQKKICMVFSHYPERLSNDLNDAEYDDEKYVFEELNLYIIEMNPSNLIKYAVVGIKIIQDNDIGRDELIDRGAYKKRVLIKVMKEIVKQSMREEKEKITLHVLIDSTLSNTIDLMIDLARGNISIGKINEKSKTKPVCCVIV